MQLPGPSVIAHLKSFSLLHCLNHNKAHNIISWNEIILSYGIKFNHFVYMYSLIPADPWFILNKTVLFRLGLSYLRPVRQARLTPRLWQHSPEDVNVCVRFSLHMCLFVYIYNYFGGLPKLFLPTYVFPFPSCLSYASVLTGRSSLLALDTIIFLFCISLAELAHVVSSLLSDTFPSISKAS